MSGVPVLCWIGLGVLGLGAVGMGLAHLRRELRRHWGNHALRWIVICILGAALFVIGAR